MNIKYRNELTDLINFNEYQYKNSRQVKKQILKSNLWFSGGVFAGISYVSYLNNSIFLALIGFLIAAICFTLYPFYVRWWQVRNLKNQQNSDFMKSVLCDHELRIEEDGLIEKTDFNETKSPWNSVGPIVLKDAYSFVYLNEIQAHVLPKASIVHGNHDDFINALKNKVSHAEA
ncbi:MAG: YcxB family protein [Deltaproteobacteria bacterium]|nr:YcxB family protein [Deltaproteobacteria bacterium]